MTTVLPQLSSELLDAAERLAAQPARRRRLRFVAFGAAGILGLGGIATAATTIWNPQVGDGTEPASLSRDAPPKAQLDALGVLRRPQTAADRGKDSEYTLRFFGRLRGVRLDYVRAVGSGYVLVSAASEGTGGSAQRLRALRARREGRPVPAALQNPLCLFARDPAGDGGGVRCFSLDDIQSGRALMGWAAADGTRTQFGLVPDRVTQVRVGSTVVNVRDNFFEVQARGRVELVDR